MKKQKGFVAISVILILVSVVVAIGSTVTYLSIGEAQSGLILYQGEDNLDFVEGCVEDVMLKIRSDQTYSATSFTHIDSVGNTATCNIAYSSGGPTNWDITVSTSSTTNVQRKIQVIFIRTSPSITLTSWKEI